VHFKLPGLLPNRSLSIYDVKGVLLQQFETKSHARYIKWNITDLKGNRLPAGSYFAVFRDGLGRKLKSFKIQVLR
jgi:hypothetical protein